MPCPLTRAKESEGVLPSMHWSATRVNGERCDQRETVLRESSELSGAGPWRPAGRPKDAGVARLLSWAKLGTSEYTDGPDERMKEWVKTSLGQPRDGTFQADGFRDARTGLAVEQRNHQSPRGSP